MEKAMTLARAKSVAGVKIPDTALCNAAVDLLESCSPAFLFSHCLRTDICGSLAVRGAAKMDDEEGGNARTFVSIGGQSGWRCSEGADRRLLQGVWRRDVW